MNRDKITDQALRQAYKKIITPIIVEYRPNALQGLIDNISPFLEDSRIRKLIKGRAESRIPMPFTPLRTIKSFNMVSTILQRERIFDLAQERDVLRIYPDNLVYALDFPTVQEEGIYDVPKARDKVKRVTTTYWTKKLMGLDQTPYQGSRITVGVLDTGSSRRHEQAPNIDFDTVTQQHRDENGHGTWCTTCIGGKTGYASTVERKTNREVPVLGMAPRTFIYAVKCLGWYIGTGSTSGIIEAVERSMNYNCDILSMSLGGTVDFNLPHEDPMFSVMQKVVAKGIIPIVAAGNEGPGKETIGTPGCFEEVLTVGAYDSIRGEIARFSSRGPTEWDTVKPDCVAPGVDIISGTVGACDRSDGTPDKYAWLSGTSMATPHVSGLVACMQEAHKTLVAKSLTIEEIKNMLKEFGSEKNNVSGWGIIDWPMYERWVDTTYGVRV